MKKTTALGAMALICASVVGGSVHADTLVWNFTDDNATVDSGALLNGTVTDFSIGNSLGTVSDPVNATSASSGYTGASGTGNIGNAARIGALSTATAGSAYYEVTLAPNAGYSLSITDFDFGTRSTATGPQAYSLRSSVDSFATDAMTGTIANDSAWSFKNNTILTPITDGAITLRLYLYNGTGSPASGTINSRLDDISITANTTLNIPAVVPLPLAAIGGMALFPLIAAGRLRRRLRQSC